MSDQGKARDATKEAVSEIERCKAEVLAARRALDDPFGCSALLDTGLRCGSPITHRTAHKDVPLCKEHVTALTKEGLTCFVTTDSFVGLSKSHPVSRAESQ